MTTSTASSTSTLPTTGVETTAAAAGTPSKLLVGFVGLPSAGKSTCTGWPQDSGYTYIERRAVSGERTLMCVVPSRYGSVTHHKPGMHY